MRRASAGWEGDRHHQCAPEASSPDSSRHLDISDADSVGVSSRIQESSVIPQGWPGLDALDVRPQLISLWQEHHRFAVVNFVRQCFRESYSSNRFRIDCNSCRCSALAFGWIILSSARASRTIPAAVPLALSGQCLEPGDHIEKLFVDAGLAQSVERAMKMFQEVGDVLVGTLHRCQAARVLAR